MLIIAKSDYHGSICGEKKKSEGVFRSFESSNESSNFLATYVQSTPRTYSREGTVRTCMHCIHKYKHTCFLIFSLYLCFPPVSSSDQHCFNFIHFFFNKFLSAFLPFCLFRLQLLQTAFRSNMAIRLQSAIRGMLARMSYRYFKLSTSISSIHSS